LLVYNTIPWPARQQFRRPAMRGIVIATLPTIRFILIASKETYCNRYSKSVIETPAPRERLQTHTQVLAPPVELPARPARLSPNVSDAKTV
jgi:hypothetical protein